MADNPKQLAEEALAQIMARLWFALQVERVYQRSNQWTCEYQDILLSLDMASSRRAAAAKYFSAGLAFATAASLGIGALTSRLILRGTGPLARLLLPRPVYAAAVQAEVRSAAAVARFAARRQAQAKAVVGIGKQWAVPLWVTKALEVTPQVVLRNLCRQKAMTAVVMLNGALPMWTGAQMLQDASGQAYPKGKMSALWQMITSVDPREELQLSIDRAERIIAGYLHNLTESQRSLLTMTDDELQHVMNELHHDIATKLHDDRLLAAEKPSEEMFLFLQSQTLMDYWLGIQNWVDALRPAASRELQQFVQQFR